MNCEAAGDRMREADLAELAYRSDTPLGRHLHECPGCRSAAQRIVADTTWLEDHLAVPPRGSADAALVSLRRARSPHRLVPWTAAAAAVLAGVLVAGPWRAPRSTPDPALTLGSERPPPVVEDAGGASLAVFSTTDPRITVVWIYQENNL